MSRLETGLQVRRQRSMAPEEIRFIQYHHGISGPRRMVSVSERSREFPVGLLGLLIRTTAGF